MNRYTYKAKRKDNGKWVYGCYVLNDFWKDHYKHYIVEHFNLIYSEFEPRYYEIDFNTLCQCLGFEDKDQDFVFENDIVTKDIVWENGFTEELKFIVKYCDNRFKWYGIDNNDSYEIYEFEKHNGDYKRNYDIKIIGNKFDKENIC